MTTLKVVFRFSSEYPQPPLASLLLVCVNFLPPMALPPSPLMCSISNAGIDVEAVAALCSFVAQGSCSLVALTLDDNAVKDEGASLIAQMLQRNKKIAHLR
jgi:hypothetical protein